MVNTISPILYSHFVMLYFLDAAASEASSAYRRLQVDLRVLDLWRFLVSQYGILMLKPNRKSLQNLCLLFTKRLSAVGASLGAESSNY